MILASVETYARIYWGDFEHVHLDRNTLVFSELMDTYARNYGAVCSEYLPKNKVQIMNAVCKSEIYRVYAATGLEVPGSRTCYEDRLVGSGIDADPELLNAQDEQTKRAGLATLSDLGSAFTKTGSAGISYAAGMNIRGLDAVRQAKDVTRDTHLLVASNACGGAPIKRFQQNLIAFALDRPPIRTSSFPARAVPSANLDYQTLLDELVSDQSKAWLFNRFKSGSIANVSVAEKGRQWSGEVGKSELRLPRPESPKRKR